MIIGKIICTNRMSLAAALETVSTRISTGVMTNPTTSRGISTTMVPATSMMMVMMKDLDGAWRVSNNIDHGYNRNQIAMIHSTTPTSQAAVRRRRRVGGRGGIAGGGTSSLPPSENDDITQSGDDGAGDGKGGRSPLKHDAVEDTVQFQQSIKDLFDKLEKSLEPMKAQNDFFVVERSIGDLGEILTIDLGPKEGKYRIEASEEEHIFEYSSPISGKILYILSSSTGEWVGIQDGHLFEGILVRDLIRQCRGLPKL